jgi:hypothetical protein
LRYIEDVSLDVDDLPTDPAALRALLIAERAQHEAEIARIGSERDRMRAIVIALQRHRFGRRSERLDPDQLVLALEDLEQSIAAAEAQQDQVTPPERSRPIRRRKTNRGALPGHLPRIEVEVDVVDRTCPCCAGELHRIGEDVAERLDMIPLRFRVLVIRRPKYACRTCSGTVVQALAPPPDRKGERPAAHLQGFHGVLQVDGYAGYRALAESGQVQLAFCWSHVRRQFYEIAVGGAAPIAPRRLRGSPNSTPSRPRFAAGRPTSAAPSGMTKHDRSLQP